MKAERKIHYAWVVCFSCALLLFVSMGLCSNAFSVYHPYIISDYGFTNTQASLVTTCRSLTSLFCVAVVDKVYNRLGLRRTIAVGLGFEVLSRLIFAFTKSFPCYCLAAVCGGITYAWAGMVPLAALIGNWFQDKHGLAMGLGVTGSGVANIIMPPILTKIISSHGIGKAFFAEAAITAVISAVVLMLAVEKPHDKGLEPYREGRSSQARKTQSVPVREERGTGLNPWQRLSMLVAMVMLAGPAGPGFNHLSILFTTEGYRYEDISWLLSSLGVGMLLGKIVVGYVYDKIGSWRANYVVGGSLVVAMFLCTLAPSKSIAVTLLILGLLGLGLPAVSVSMAIWARDLEGNEGSKSAMKQYTTCYSLGALIFSPLPGMIADYTGRYVGAYALFAAMALVMAVLLQVVYYRNAKLEDRQRKAIR